MTPGHEGRGSRERQAEPWSQLPSEEDQLREILQKERTKDFSQELTSLKRNIHGSILRSHIRQLSHVHKEGAILHTNKWTRVPWKTWNLESLKGLSTVYIQKTGSNVHGWFGNLLRKMDFTCRLADFSEFIITRFIPQIHYTDTQFRESDRKDVCTPVLYNHRLTWIPV